MSDSTLTALVGLAAFVGLVHTLAGPDHYVPFIVMSRAGRWSLSRTLTITALCGVGHVLGSVVLGAVGVALGFTVGQVEGVERHRGDMASWLLIGFGLAYAAWGIRRAIRNRPHVHWHAHADGIVHAHEHRHWGEHAHLHAQGSSGRTLTPWVLFTIFVFGPCEPLIPMLMIPAAGMSAWGVMMVAAVFATVMILTMTGVVLVGSLSAARFCSAGLERYSHAVAGLAMAACGTAMHLGF